MPTERAWAVGKDSVTTWYEANCDADCPCFSVWEGKYLRFSYSGDDLAIGSDLLMVNLAAAEQQGSSAVMLLKLHPKTPKGFITEKSEYNASLPFRVVAAQEDSLNKAYQDNGGYYQGVIGKLNDRLAKMEREYEDKEETGIIGTINGLIGSPEMAPVIGGVIMGIINKFLPGVMPPGGMAQLPAPQMSGVSDTIEWAMSQLQSADPDIEADLIRLAHLSIKNKPLFDMLIGQLRTM